jgi:hypothetical protein
VSEKYFGVYPAVVVSSEEDPFGRVQVTVPMVAPNEALWATLVIPNTGQDAVPPPAGTGVVVAYGAGDPSHPYVLGSFSPW